jgi:hypothetical protein
MLAAHVSPASHAPRRADHALPGLHGLGDQLRVHQGRRRRPRHHGLVPLPGRQLDGHGALSPLRDPAPALAPPGRLPGRPPAGRALAGAPERDGIRAPGGRHPGDGSGDERLPDEPLHAVHAASRLGAVPPDAGEEDPRGRGGGGGRRRPADGTFRPGLRTRRGPRRARRRVLGGADPGHRPGGRSPPVAALRGGVLPVDGLARRDRGGWRGVARHRSAICSPPSGGRS